MFICDKNFSCCNYQYADSYKDLEEDAKDCGHLIEVAPVIHAHWIDMLGKWECSNCKYTVSPWNNTPYCPNCGAKMDEEEN